MPLPVDDSQGKVRGPLLVLVATQEDVPGHGPHHEEPADDVEPDDHASGDQLLAMSKQQFGMPLFDFFAIFFKGLLPTRVFSD